MALPKLSYPIFDLYVPSLDRDVKFRQFLVKEEKILLTAQAGGDPKEVILSIKQVINNCVQEDIDVDNLTTYDLEYLFIKLRAKSVNNIIKITYRDPEEESEHDIEIDLDKIEITKPVPGKNKIQINKKMGLVLKYPSASLMGVVNAESSETELFFTLLRFCIDTVYDEDKVYKANEYSIDEIDEFIQSLNVKTLQQIQEFFTSMPKLSYTVEYTTNSGKQRKIELNNINDFFTLG